MLRLVARVTVTAIATVRVRVTVRQFALFALAHDSQPSLLEILTDSEPTVP